MEAMDILVTSPPETLTALCQVCHLWQMWATEFHQFQQMLSVPRACPHHCAWSSLYPQEGSGDPHSPGGMGSAVALGFFLQT